MRDRLTTIWKQVRPLVRDVTTQVLFAAGTTHPDRRAEGRFTIVTFHRVLPAELRATYPLPGLAVTPDELDALLTFLRAHYTCGPLAQLFARWQRGETPDRPWLALTFDDTPWDNLGHALPVLARHGLLATFFAPAGLIDRGEPPWHDRLGFAVAQVLRQGTREQGALEQALEQSVPAAPTPEARARAVVSASKTMAAEALVRRLERVEALCPDAVPSWARLMNWDELREVAGAGHEVGSHSLTHPILPRCTTEEIEREIVASRELLSSRLAVPIRTFCYPNGDWDARALDAVTRAGYECAVTTRMGLNMRGDDARTLRRIDLQTAHFARRGPTPGVAVGRTAWRLSGFASDGPQAGG